MSVLVDSSIWIDYFKGGDKSSKLDDLINDNSIVTNDLILAELIPFLKFKKQLKVVELLKEIKCLPLLIDWEEITNIQLKCLKNGSNGIGIPDLIIAQNAKDNNCKIYTLDKHFGLINRVTKVLLF